MDGDASQFAPLGAPFLLSASASHRDRLLAAMAELIREQGFAKTTVADVVGRARTSRRTFYQHFEDREACFLALNDLVNEHVLRVITEAATGEQPWAERVDRTIAAYLGVLAGEPELAQEFMRELPYAGAEGWARTQHMKDLAAQRLSRLVEEAREYDSAIRPLSVEAAAFIVGGFHELGIRAFDAGRDPRDLQSLASDMITRITTRD